MRFVVLENLGTSCPSQWEAITDTGERVYIRYRFGWLSMSYVNDGEFMHVKYEWRVGGEYDGVMDTDDMLEHLRNALLLDPE